MTITKTGNKQLLAGDSMRYDLTVANTSNVALDNFFWHDRFPTDCATAKSITTGSSDFIQSGFGFTSPRCHTDSAPASGSQHSPTMVKDGYS